MQFLSLLISRFQMVNVYWLWRILLGSWAVTLFFGVTRDPIGNIGEGIVWLPFILQINPIYPLLLGFAGTEIFQGGVGFWKKNRLRRAFRRVDFQKFRLRRANYLVKIVKFSEILPVSGINHIYYFHF